MKTYIRNIDIYAEDGIIRKGSLLTDGEKIAGIFKEGDAGVKADRYIDGTGRAAVPGYIDVHVHGGNGHDIGDGTAQSICGTRDYYQQHGVTMIYPSYMANKLSAMEQGLISLREAMKTNAPGKAEIAAAHVEGPFINPAYKGCLSDEFIITFDDDNILFFEKYRDVIARTTIAPENGNNMEYIQDLVRLGVQVSVGHSCATISQVEEAVKRGATSITHLYNAQSQTHKEGPYRIGGVTEAGLSIDELYTETICDGYHLPNELIRIAYRCKTADKMLVVSDASVCAGMPSGTVVHTCGVDFFVTDGIAMNKERTSFASSTSPLDRMVRHLIFDVKLPVEDVVKMASATPAKLMGCFDRKGSIAVGKDADINIVDDGFNVLQTICRGE